MQEQKFNLQKTERTKIVTGDEMFEFNYRVHFI
jgi:hypothetical protein